MKWYEVPFDVIIGAEKEQRKKEEQGERIPLYMPAPEPPPPPDMPISGTKEESDRGVTIIDYSID
jgi:hypothetical protein